ncbi:NAD(P)-dependent oxidoreductase [Croceicoccus sp. YJ47]|uniref:NAD-dependent epimerase/dehydratase family protein n=1 Tax=Croceicoccus sp. YJ47 TaxID=2798724 RepID=UPI00192498D5|nr:NAD-dependent epimerase/dehydratase family protein [Croceicoccus sp. YJ47]QQN73289.1 NAD-dependent epimerase/dehydratase family protein [Croceicoccus sp. YJ47]
MRIAITGATGFVGSTLLDLASGEGHAAAALTRREQAPRSGVDWVRGDLADRAGLRELCAGADAVIHVAGVVNAPDAAGFHAGNVEGTRNVLDAARDGGVAHFVHVSSLAAREPSLSHYGQSKHAAESLVTAGGPGWVIVRPPAVYGPRDTEMFELFKAAKTGIVPLPPPGRTSMIHVGDLSRLLLILARDATQHGAVLEPDDGRENGWSHAEMARAIGTAMGRRVRPVHVPAALLRLAARGDRMMRGAGAKLTPDRVGYMLHPDWTARAECRPPRALWQAEIDTGEGLAETARWYRAQGWL